MQTHAVAHIMMDIFKCMPWRCTEGRLTSVTTRQARQDQTRPDKTRQDQTSHCYEETRQWLTLHSA